jgi:tRNA U38,U39,U40 pseudouridine synthase TruA
MSAPSSGGDTGGEGGTGGKCGKGGKRSKNGKGGKRSMGGRDMQATGAASAAAAAAAPHGPTGTAQSCGHCHATLPSRSQLFRHLRESGCREAAARDGLVSRARILLILGFVPTRDSTHQSPSLDAEAHLERAMAAIFAARNATSLGATSLDTAPSGATPAAHRHLQSGSWASRSEARSCLPLSLGPGIAAVGDAVSCLTDVLPLGENGSEAYVRDLNAHLPPHVRVHAHFALGRGAHLHAETDCTRWRFECVLPISCFWRPGFDSEVGGGEGGEGGDGGDGGEGGEGGEGGKGEDGSCRGVGGGNNNRVSGGGADQEEGGGWGRTRRGGTWALCESLRTDVRAMWHRGTPWQELGSWHEFLLGVHCGNVPLFNSSAAAQAAPLQRRVLSTILSFLHSPGWLQRQVLSHRLKHVMKMLQGSRQGRSMSQLYHNFTASTSRVLAHEPPARRRVLRFNRMRMMAGGSTEEAIGGVVREGDAEGAMARSTTPLTCTPTRSEHDGGGEKEGGNDHKDDYKENGDGGDINSDNGAQSNALPVERRSGSAAGRSDDGGGGSMELLHEGREYLCLSMSGNGFLRGQVQRLVGLLVATVRHDLPLSDVCRVVFSPGVLVNVPAMPDFSTYFADVRYSNFETKHNLSLRVESQAVIDDAESPSSRLESFRHLLHKCIAAKWITGMVRGLHVNGDDGGTCTNGSSSWLPDVFDPQTEAMMKEVRAAASRGRRSPHTHDAPNTVGRRWGTDDAAMGEDVKMAYARVLGLLQDVERAGKWPQTTPRRLAVINSSDTRHNEREPSLPHNKKTEGTERPNEVVLPPAATASAATDTADTADDNVTCNGDAITAAGGGAAGSALTHVAENKVKLGDPSGSSGSFSVGAMPSGSSEPKGNSLFPELTFAVFELEALLLNHDSGGRPRSSTCTINRNAQFKPHKDKGAGAGQSLSLIVGLGDYVEGEIVVDGCGDRRSQGCHGGCRGGKEASEAGGAGGGAGRRCTSGEPGEAAGRRSYDIRYRPLTFNGWAHIHWTEPFRGERFSLVWYTPVGCEGVAFIDRGRAGNGSAPRLESKGCFVPPPPHPQDIPEGVPTVLLNNGARMPLVGLGTFRSQGEECRQSVSAAIRHGYVMLCREEEEVCLFG